MKISAADALELTIDERIQLVADIWDSIVEHPEAVEVTPEVRALLDERLAAYRKDPDAGSPWSEVKERILNQG
jgi:putative addiction module component (TIGR02574 family)